MSNHPAGRKKATVYRMVSPKQTCPYGLKAVHLLKRAGYEVDDHHLATREETDAFKARQGVQRRPRSSSATGASAGTTTCAASWASA
jgi:glutaredoxin